MRNFTAPLYFGESGDESFYREMKPKRSFLRRSRQFFAFFAATASDAFNLYGSITFFQLMLAPGTGECTVSSSNVVTAARFSFLFFIVAVVAIFVGALIALVGLVARIKYFNHEGPLPVWHPDHLIATIVAALFSDIPMAFVELASGMVWVRPETSDFVRSLVTEGIVQAEINDDQLTLYVSYGIMVYQLGRQSVSMAKDVWCSSEGRQLTRTWKRLALGSAAALALFLLVLIYFLVDGRKYTPRPINLLAPQTVHLGPAGTVSSLTRSCSCACDLVDGIHDVRGTSASGSYGNHTMRLFQPQCNPTAISGFFLGAFCQREVNFTASSVPITNLTVLIPLGLAWNTTVAVHVPLAFPPVSTKDVLIPSDMDVTGSAVGPLPFWAKSITVSFERWGSGYSACRTSDIQVSPTEDLNIVQTASVSCGQVRVTALMDRATAPQCLRSACSDPYLYSDCTIALTFPLNIEFSVYEMFCPDNPSVWFTLGRDQSFNPLPRSG